MNGNDKRDARVYAGQLVAKLDKLKAQSERRDLIESAIREYEDRQSEAARLVAEASAEAGRVREKAEADAALRTFVDEIAAVTDPAQASAAQLSEGATVLRSVVASHLSAIGWLSPDGKADVQQRADRGAILAAQLEQALSMEPDSLIDPGAVEIRNRFGGSARLVGWYTPGEVSDLKAKMARIEEEARHLRKKLNEAEATNARLAADLDTATKPAAQPGSPA